MRQFDGSDRLLDHIRLALSGDLFFDIKFAIAYAKSGPLERLQDNFKAWKSKKATKRHTSVIFGIDQKGTSIQALVLALSIFDDVYITNTASSSTFHPKMYLFEGPTCGRSIIGSHNLTVGGTETNFEAGVELDYSLPSEASDFQHFVTAWNDIAASNMTKPLTTSFLQQLSSMGLLQDESATVSASAAKKATLKSAGKAYPFPLVHPKPPSALPKTAPSLSSTPPPTKAPGASAKAPAHASTATAGTQPTTSNVASSTLTFTPTSLLIQIVPHHNGEVFLSKSAVNQNPAFFGFPFTGTTTTKSGKSGYPQRLPDPVVDITVYDAGGQVVLAKLGYNLNTVYYENKGEIRITVSPDIRTKIAPFAILHMQPGQAPTTYNMEIYNPGSSTHSALLASCNQVLPSGGGVARRMGWL